MSNEMIVKQDGPILHITLNRPDDGNGVTDPMAREFTALINQAHETSEIVVLRGAGKDFCVGRAVFTAPGSPNAIPEAYARRAAYDVIFDAYWAVRRSPIPIVGVIQGRAMGFGLAVAALCDVSFASDAATFNIPEMAHNIMPTMVMSSIFDRMNRNAIAWMTYSTDFINAERALHYGIVSTVVPAAKLEAEVAAFCDKMANTPRPAIRGLKEYLRVAPTMDAQGGIDYARNIHAVVNTASEMKGKSRKKG
jgi:enoyl-CoA hydratase